MVFHKIIGRPHRGSGRFSHSEKMTLKWFCGAALEQPGLGASVFTIRLLFKAEGDYSM